MDKITITVERDALDDVIGTADAGLSLLLGWKYRTVAECEKTEKNIANINAAIAEADAKAHCYKCKREIEPHEAAYCDACEHWFCAEHLRLGFDCDFCEDCYDGLKKAEKEEPHG